MEASVTPINTKMESKFDEFWNLYPSMRKQGKAMCRAKWEAITGPNGLRTRTLDKDSQTFVNITISATPEEIIAGLKRCREQWKAVGKYGWRDDGKFIPLPATWLNQGRWDDLNETSGYEDWGWED